MAKILHLATDEKFISAAEYLYERAFPSQNVFFVVLPDKRNYKLRFLKEKENYYFFTENKKALSYITEQLDEYDLVVLHSSDIFKSFSKRFSVPSIRKSYKKVGKTRSFSFRRVNYF